MAEQIFTGGSTYIGAVFGALKPPILAIARHFQSKRTRAADLQLERAAVPAHFLSGRCQFFVSEVWKMQN